MKVKYNGTEYDSKEEVEFVQWLEEAQTAGYVEDYHYQPETFVLSGRKADENHKFLLRPQTYTPDFYVLFNRKFSQRFPGIIVFANDDNFWGAYFDIKGIFGRGMNNSSAYTFPVLQKWLYDKKQIFINKVVARDSKTKIKNTNEYKVTKEGFFSKTWVPTAIAYDKRRRFVRNKSFANCKLIGEVKS